MNSLTYLVEIGRCYWCFRIDLAIRF